MGPYFSRHPVNFVSKPLPSIIFLIQSWCLLAVVTCLMLIRWQKTAGTECVVKIVLNSSNVMCHCQVIDCIGCSFILLRRRHIYSNTENRMRFNDWSGHFHGCSVGDAGMSCCHFLAAFILETPGCTTWGSLIILLAVELAPSLPTYFITEMLRAGVNKKNYTLNAEMGSVQNCTSGPSDIKVFYCGQELLPLPGQPTKSQWIIIVWL